MTINYFKHQHHGSKPLLFIYFYIHNFLELPLKLFLFHCSIAALEMRKKTIFDKLS